jgi:predicted nucleic acid-binding protein
MIYLVDTCIWRDFYEDRVSKTNAPIGKFASEFFMKVLQRKDTILFSEGLLRELGVDFSKKDINDMLTVFMYSNILMRIDITESDFLEAEKLALERNLPKIDCLNAIHARNYNAVLITRDRHYFENLQDIAFPLKPEQVI